MMKPFEVPFKDTTTILLCPEGLTKSSSWFQQHFLEWNEEVQAATQAIISASSLESTKGHFHHHQASVSAVIFIKIMK